MAILVKALRCSLAAAFLLACALPASAKILAKVDGAPITDDDVAIALEDLGPTLPEQLDDAQRQTYVLNFLIDLKLLAKKAASAELDNDPDFAREMAYYHDKILMQDLLGKVAKDAATDAAVQKVYDDAAQAQAPQLEIHARHILVPTEDEAKAALARVKAGEDFAKVADELSKDPGSKGGDLGWFTKDKMVPEFADAAFKLKPGEISDPVKSPFGWHIIQVEEIRQSQFPPLAQVKDQVVHYVVQKAQGDFIGDLRSHAQIERTDAPAAPAAAPGSSLGQQASAQTPAPGYVPIPDDIRCSVQGMSFMSSVGKNGEMVNTGGSVKGVTCSMSGKSPGRIKDIPLVSTQITDGMLPTKDFGNLRITPTNNLTSGELYIAIGANKLQSFREYLQK